MSKSFFDAMLNSGNMRIMETEQFYDEEKGCFLNGRQVVGRCPYPNCKSEKGYADECDMCHQYLPKDLIDPVSMLSNKKPVLRKIANYYFDISKYNEQLNQIIDIWDKDRRSRKYVLKEIKEFLKKPEIYIKQEEFAAFSALEGMPEHELLDVGSNKPSFTAVFNCLEDRECACKILSENGVKFRTGKTLVPFRITGNYFWGVSVKSDVLNDDDVKGLTFYVWPESLWAPLSFTKTFLSNADEGFVNRDYRDWWYSADSDVYQFIAEDNMYFYGPPEQAMFLATQGKDISLEKRDGVLNIPNLIVNKHSLYMGLKASSSGKYRAPLAKELFEHYTVSQLRLHFLGLAFGDTNVNVSLKAFNPDAKDDEVDCALKEGNMLINVFNRVLRRMNNFVCEHLDGVVDVSEMVASDAVKEICEKNILNYEDRLYHYKFHVAVNLLDAFLKEINKRFDASVRGADTSDKNSLKQIVVDTLYMIRVACALLNPFVPSDADKVAAYFGFNENYCDWKYIFDDVDTFVKGDIRLNYIEDETYFFKGK